jgi:hypothetical protein
MFARHIRTTEVEEKKDIFAPVADLMVGVVFIFIIMVMALSLLIMNDVVSRSEYDSLKRRLNETEASRSRLADFARHFKDAKFAAALGKTVDVDFH